MPFATLITNWTWLFLGLMTLVKSELSHSSRIVIAQVPQAASTGTLRAPQVAPSTIRRICITVAYATTACIHSWSQKATRSNSTTATVSMDKVSLLKALTWTQVNRCNAYQPLSPMVSHLSSLSANLRALLRPTGRASPLLSRRISQFMSDSPTKTSQMPRGRRLIG